MKKTLILSNINFSRDNFKLENITFEINEGDIVGLIGENGAGKTTLFNLIFKNISPSSGSMLFLEKEYTYLDKSEMAIILDKNYFNNSFTAKDIDKIYSKMFKSWNTKLFYSYLKKFNLSENKKIKSYSHGMKVKLNFAYAFCRKPKILLLDEATNGLDPIFRNNLLIELLNFSKETNCTCLISSHILSDLEKITNRVLYLKNGKISEEKDISNLEKIMMKG